MPAPHHPTPPQTTPPQTTPLHLTPRRPFAPEALDNCAAALATGSLSSINGRFTAEFETGFAALHGARHGIATSSGTAAIHTAIAALDLPPGTEVVLPPITDAGSVTPLLVQGLVPVFCDVDDHLAMTPEAIEAVITPRTGAIMVVHLFGGVSDVRAIRALADIHGLKLVEDCAQAHATQLGESHVGTFGDIGMFSLQQSKHLTSGDGGLCLTNDDDLAARMRLFRDKGWDRSATGARSYPVLGLNYRITELQSAVAVAGLPGLPGVVARRRQAAARLDAALSTVPGITTWSPPPAAEASYWCYPFFVPAALRDEFGRRLLEAGVPVTPGYIGAPIFECLVATADIHAPVPHTRDALSRLIVFWLHEHHTDDDLDAVAGAIGAIVRDLEGQA
ncbi:DegT/DnrJ/EryC1/StrS family aminotransferase [Propionibacteriaceae bacterium G1746]